MKSKRFHKDVYIALFSVYLALLLSWVLFSDVFGRSGFDNLKGATAEDYAAAFDERVCLIPFKTIFGFFKGLADKTVSLRAFVINIFGNILVFAPFGVFLPLIFKAQRKLSRFLLTVIFIVLSIETLQFLLLTGYSDIDDLILNTLGACAAFVIFKRFAKQ